MTCYYVVDDSARRVDKTAFPTAEQAIELAAESARKLNRAITVWEIESDREPDEDEYPKGPLAERYHGYVLPDGSFCKSKNGENPYKEYMDNPEDNEESLEKSLGLDPLVLGSAVSALDKVIATTRYPEVYMRVSRVRNQLAAAREGLNMGTKTDQMLVAKFSKNDQFKTIDGRTITVQAKTDTTITAKLTGAANAMTFAGREFAKVLLKSLAKKIQAAEDKEEEPKEEEKESDDKDDVAVAHHMEPGAVGMLDQKDLVHVLDAADGLYVVLMNGSVTQIPDDVTRVTRLTETTEEDRKRIKSWKAFVKILLRNMGVENMGELNSEQKTRLFEQAKRKWPKIETKMLSATEKDPSKKAHPAKPAKEAAPKPAAPAPKAPAPKPEPKPAPKAEEPPPQEASASLIDYCMKLCGNNIEVAAKLEQAVRSVLIGRDSTKLHAVSMMTEFSGRQLPEGWFTPASTLAKKSVKATADVNLMVPMEVRVCAARALSTSAEQRSPFTEVTKQTASTLAGAAPIDANLLFRMNAFFNNATPENTSPLVWAAWGGSLGKAWVDHNVKAFGA